MTAPTGASPAHVRQTALEAVVEESDAVVFVDSDDILDPSRVAAARDALATSDVVACALRLADATGVELGETFGPLAETDPAAELPTYNVFGLSNSAYRTDVACLPAHPGRVRPHRLASRDTGLGFGARMVFDDTPRMVYRQGASRATRVSPPFDAEQVLDATSLVLGHYRLVLDNPPALPAAVAASLAAARDRAERFRRAISASPRILSRYIDALNASTAAPTSGGGPSPTPNWSTYG